MSDEPIEIEINLDDIATTAGLHERLAFQLAFPDYYGKNWDAFFDCVRDPQQSRMPDVLRLSGWSAFETRLPRDARIMKSCLAAMTRVRPECVVVWA
jgi:RNAse (barnase) inhibitor barstar